MNYFLVKIVSVAQGERSDASVFYIHGEGKDDTVISGKCSANNEFVPFMIEFILDYLIYINIM